jgi:hypothetical protein
MKKSHRVFITVTFLVALAGIVFWGCSSNNVKEDPPCTDITSCVDSSSSDDDNGGGDGNESSSSFDEQFPGSSSDGENPLTSSSSGGSGANSSSGGTSSGVVVSSSSSATATIPGANCEYMPIWCGALTFDKVITKSLDTSDVGAEEKGWTRPNCIYATAITQIGNESGGISINGTQFANGSASRCGGDSGHGHGETASCATKFASIAKRDGGYYIYVPAWAGQNFKTTGGTPACSGTGPGPGPGGTSSSSSGGVSAGSGSCVEPMYGVPPGGVKSCVKKDNKCYTCNPDRGNDCTQSWIWQANQVDEKYWYVEVSCNEAPTNNNTLTCTGLAQTGVAGVAITQPTVKCNENNVTASFTGAPTWNNPSASSYTVSASANCGGNKTASCGTIVVTAAPTANTLTCTGLATTGVAGTAITQPTVRCGTSAVTNPTFTGAPTWANPTANTYTVSANATGTCTQAASCGTIKVNPKLTCGNPTPSTVTAGTAVTAPAVTCGTVAVAAANISWSGAPNYWSGPAVGIYNNIKATANAGDCNGQTANCGALTVNGGLTCGSVTQAIASGQRPTKPTVTCGGTAVTTGITWSPNIDNALTATVNTVTATAVCGGSNQTATCSGTITVTTATQSSSSGNSGGGSGTTTYTPKSPGGSSGQTTQYWDACKPSCSWGGKGGLQANACSITGTNIGHNDSDRSACDGGNAFVCMNQAPWSLTNNGKRISFGYVAVNDGACGDCYQLDFPSGEVMVVMKNNIGSINGKFDIMIPGGGVGDFNALTRQIQNSGVSNPDMGVQYGGFRGKCGWNYSTQSVNCVKDMCEAAFKNLPDLKAGCLWYANTLGNSGDWNNPTVKYQKVDCPAELRSKY